MSSVHGVTGVVGSLAIGFFGQKSFNSDGRDGLFFGDHSPYLLGVQALAVLVVGLWSALITILLLKCIDQVFGLKIPFDEELGLDEEEHGEQAYGWRHSIISEPLTEQQIQTIVRGSVNHHIQAEQRRMSLVPPTNCRSIESKSPSREHGQTRRDDVILPLLSFSSLGFLLEKVTSIDRRSSFANGCQNNRNASRAILTSNFDKKKVHPCTLTDPSDLPGRIFANSSLVFRLCRQGRSIIARLTNS